MYVIMILISLNGDRPSRRGWRAVTDPEKKPYEYTTKKAAWYMASVAYADVYTFNRHWLNVWTMAKWLKFEEKLNK